MTKAGKLVLFGFILLALAVALSVWRFVLPNETTIAPSGAAAAPAYSGPSTEIIKYVPPAPLATTPVETGSCWTNSIAAPYRADAWRCSVGNSIMDPCFAIPESKNLLCGAVPAMPRSTSTFVLKLSQPLPPSVIPPGPLPNDWGWLIKLQGGTLCSPFTGTRPFTAEGEVANYGCAPGPLGKDVLLFGDFNTSTPQWTAEAGTLTIPTSSLPSLKNKKTVPILTLWQ